jgi:hypothetical protein
MATVGQNQGTLEQSPIDREPWQNLNTNTATSNQSQVSINGTMSSTSKSKKAAKAKKGPDPNETGKLLAAKITQLELDKAGEKDQEQEIGMLLYWIWVLMDGNGYRCCYEKFIY